MTWHYRCPKCWQPIEVAWESIEQETTCPLCGTAHHAPTPGQDHTAYVDGETWPPELEAEVIALCGGGCIVPGCDREHTALVPRLPLSKGGRLSVENLLPACAQHAAARGEEDYFDWLSRLVETGPVIASSGITITSATADVVPLQSLGRVLAVQPVAGQAALPGPFPTGMRLLFAAPFVPAAANRLVLYYEWKLGPGEACAVVLGAWPRADQPDFSKGMADSRYFVTNEHRAAARAASSALLELVVSKSKDEVWVAAAWIQAGHERQVVTSYYLAAVTDVREADVI